MSIKPPSEERPKGIQDPSGARLNWLRAGVLGANDGIVSIAALVAGISGASVSSNTFLVVLVAGLAGGALSMAIGEYVSVSSQLDAEKAMVKRGTHPNGELSEGEMSGPWHAAGASLIAFLVGGLIPFLAVFVPCPESLRLGLTFVLVLMALILTGFISARLGAAPPLKAVMRNASGGTLAMILTYFAGMAVDSFNS